MAYPTPKRPEKMIGTVPDVSKAVSQTQYEPPFPWDSFYNRQGRLLCPGEGKWYQVCVHMLWELTDPMNLAERRVCVSNNQQYAE